MPEDATVAQMRFRIFASRPGRRPRVSVRPSNYIPGRYHGLLDDGYLIEC